MKNNSSVRFIETLTSAGPFTYTQVMEMVNLKNKISKAGKPARLFRLKGFRLLGGVLFVIPKSF